MEPKPSKALAYLVVLALVLLLGSGLVALLPGARATTQVVQECGGSQYYSTNAVASPFSLSGNTPCSPPTGPYQNYFVYIVTVFKLNGSAPSTTSESVTFNPMTGQPIVAFTKYGTYAISGNSMVVDLWTLTFTQAVYRYGNLGNAFINASWTGGGTLKGGIFESQYYGVNQGAPIYAVASVTGNSTSNTLSVRSQAGDYIYDVIDATGTAAVTFTPNAAQNWSDNSFRARDSWKVSSGSSSSMSWSISPTTQFLHVVVDVAQYVGSDPASTSSYVSWCSGAEFVNGTFSSTTLIGDNLQLTSGSTTGTWTSPLTSDTGILAGVNLTYASANATQYVSNVAVLDSLGNVIWQDNVQLYPSGSSTLMVSSLPVTSWQLRLTLVGVGATSTVSCAGVLLKSETTTPPAFDWLPYLIVAALLIVGVVALLIWRYVA